ncbi:MAG: DUF1501 domain-containing protein [Verrucomicrobiales bacterium]
MKTRDKDLKSRREFLRQAACAKLGYFGLVGALSQMRLFNASLAAQENTGDYKALVCIFLFGGNDSNNLLVPYSGQHRNRYENARGILALPKSEVLQISPTNAASGQEWSLHPNCSGMASLFNSGKLAMVQNVGTLAYPIADRTEYLSGSVPLPPQVFSHSDQQTQWQSSVPDKPFSSGWGGRLADLVDAGYNENSNVSMNISLNGINSFQVGQNVTQYVVNRNEGATSLWGYGSSTDRYRDALNEDGSYKNSITGQRLRRFEEIMNFSHANLQEEAYTSLVRRAREFEGVIGGAISEAEGGGVDFDTNFEQAQTSLGDQLKMIAKLIAGRSNTGNNRQIFFASAGGYDTHAAQLPSHANLMTELSSSLLAFQTTLDALGVADNVVTFESSDFTRTFTPNGSDANSSGSDHGWGGHQFVMGGPVNGKKLYGKYPNTTPGGPDDAGGTRGRWIPSTSVDQYSSKIAEWFGVDSNSMDTIFPNLGRFNDPNSASANLDFI